MTRTRWLRQFYSFVSDVGIFQISRDVIQESRVVK